MLALNRSVCRPFAHANRLLQATLGVWDPSRLSWKLAMYNIFLFLAYRCGYDKCDTSLESIPRGCVQSSSPWLVFNCPCPGTSETEGKGQTQSRSCDTIAQCSPRKHTWIVSEWPGLDSSGCAKDQVYAHMCDSPSWLLNMPSTNLLVLCWPVPCT